MLRFALVLLLLSAAAVLAGCGNKGPLQLPPTRPATSAPIVPPASAAPAAASSARTPASSATS